MSTNKDLLESFIGFCLFAGSVIGAICFVLVPWIIGISWMFRHIGIVK